MSTEAEIKDSPVEDEDLVSDAESSIVMNDTWTDFHLPRIHMRFDLPPWFAAWTLVVVAYVITSTAESCRCR